MNPLSRPLPAGRQAPLSSSPIKGSLLKIKDSCLRQAGKITKLKINLYE
jgi:hypothetical protein